MTPVQKLSDVFGGATELARAIGVSRSLIVKWRQRSSPGRKRGEIPSRYNDAIVRAAKERGIRHDKVAPHLTAHVCPLCDQPLRPGQIIDWTWVGHLMRDTEK